ncbi:hypothetical protein FHS15_005799 [Paenibacillus castaneae]|nr:hypothetical protein [Paenibacillus castaneae]
MDELIEPVVTEAEFVFNDFHTSVVYFMTLILFFVSAFVMFKMVKK